MFFGLRPSKIALLLAIAGTTTLSLSGASPDASGVLVGGEPVAKNKVQTAVTQCAQNEPTLSSVECLQKYWVPRWLVDRKASEERSHRSDALSFEHADLMHRALVDQIRAEQEAPTKEELKTFIDANKRDFVRPVRVRIFRILLEEKEEASELLKELGQHPTLDEFRALCRKHSIDKATHERGGDLGYVWPDGSTDIPQVTAEPSLYRAALVLEDGELGPKPVAEEDDFAVIWRRGSLPSEDLSAEKEELIARLIVEKKADTIVSEILTDLKESKVKDRNDLRLGKLRRKENNLFLR